MKWNLAAIFLPVLSMLPVALSPAYAGNLVGNGGGAWVCRQVGDPKIIWAVVVDVFEAQAQFPVQDDEGRSEKAIIDRITRRIEAIDPWLAAAFRWRYARVREQWTPVSGMKLEVIDDALYYGQPAPESCLMGTLAYEQAVNFYPDGRILADTRIIEALDAQGRAALYVHEALYLLFRELYGDTDSLRTRRSVSLLFSKKPAAALRTAFDWMHPLNYVPGAAARFQDLGAFADGVAPARYADRWGYITSTGRWAVANRYAEARSFSGGLGAVRTAEGWGFIDAKGRKKIAPAFDDVSAFDPKTGLAAARKDGLWGIIDVSGAFKLAPTFETLTALSDGRALATLPGDQKGAKRVVRIVDIAGQTLATLDATAARGFSNGIAAVAKGANWRYVDVHGNTLAEGFDEAADAHGGKVVARERGRGWTLFSLESGALRVDAAGERERPLVGSDGTVIRCDRAAKVCTLNSGGAGGDESAFPIGDALRTGFEGGFATFERGGLFGFHANLVGARAAK